MPGYDSTILYLEADPRDRRLVTEVLTSANLGIRVLHSERVEAVPEIVSQHAVDLFLTGLDFPDHTPHSLLDQLAGYLPAIPIVVVTRNDDEQAAVAAIKQGAADYLMKSTDDLRRLPRAVLRAIAHGRERYRQQSTVDALRDTNSRLRMALQSSEIDFWQLDLDSGLVSFSRERRHDPLGHPAPPLPSTGVTLQAWVARIHPEDRPQLLALIDDSLHQRRNQWEVEYRLLNDNEPRWYLCRAMLLPDDPAPPGRLIGCQIDIHVRKLVDLSRLRLDLAFQQSIDGIAITDLEGNIQFANPSWARLHNCPPEAVLGHPIREFEVPGRPVLPNLAIGDDSRDLPDAMQSETWHVRPDGTRFPCWLAASVLRDSAQRPTGAMLILHDASDLHQTQQQLRESNERLRETLDELRSTQQQLIRQERLRALGVMASGIAHDFNNSLSVILGFSELLLGNPAKLADPLQTQRYLELIRTAATGASRVVDRLRAFYRQQEAGHPAKSVDLARLVEQAVDLTEPRWRHQAQAENRAIVIQRNLPPLPPFDGNESELREALVNLLINAIDALSDGGSIAIQARVDREAIHLSVSDSGCGMPEEIANQCLEPFFTTKGEHGTGMGLWIVNGVVRRHGGSVDIASTPGHGTTVTLHLPVRANSPEDASSDEPARRIRPLSILAVDDEPAVLEILAEYLRLDRHSVCTVAGGLAALDLLGSRQFDLVITDRAMPDMSGDRLTEEIKARYPRLPCIMITGFGRMMKDAGTIPGSIDAIVGKPIDLHELRQAIAAVVEPPETLPPA